MKDLRFESKSASLQTLLLTILTASQHTSLPFLSAPPGWQKPRKRGEPSANQNRMSLLSGDGLACPACLSYHLIPTHSALHFIFLLHRPKLPFPPSCLQPADKKQVPPPTTKAEKREERDTGTVLYCTSEK